MHLVSCWPSLPLTRAEGSRVEIHELLEAQDFGEKRDGPVDIADREPKVVYTLRRDGIGHVDTSLSEPVGVGLNAGIWTIGLALSGNEIGLPLKEVQAMDPAELDRRRQRASTRMYQAGAHYVVDSIADVMPSLDAIEARLTRGERP